MTSDDRISIALIRCLIIQAARDGELQLVGRSDVDLRKGIDELIRELVNSEWTIAAQLGHESKLVRAAHRFVADGEPDLAVVMFATAVEHLLNGMLEVGLKRRGQELDQSTEKASLAYKLTTRWRDLFGLDFPGNLRLEILQLADTRNNFVHYKWPSLSELEHSTRGEAIGRIAAKAPTLLAALDALENSLVFAGERLRLERVLDEMKLFDVPE